MPASAVAAHLRQVLQAEAVDCEAAALQELGRAAHDTGAALFALRARANETLIEQLATNRITPQQAITEARNLTGL